ncbi:23S rRNA (pseudouridine(1915)-N(3))-methyltransferase RlmH [Desulfonatronovibrio magnus]|uniref:23S rRNA (pseudouridine(1915)-N(3))-methyltransferase RlmH n=1 Tax=Desulfonatronovibrio magnus TaxID=698827 RepID=UPI0005EBCEA7|nr:23S rRNA (pseudouridine(1915)-N(3))-methyltransferase RlmH [Desulfonatronovibrio magnus]
MPGIKIILTGKIRKGFRAEAFDYYLKKSRHYIDISLIVIKDARSGDALLRAETEGRTLLKKVTPHDLLIVLDEKGKELTSCKFAQKMQTWDELPGKTPCFIIGGSYGLWDQVRQHADFILSLGPMTMPHELAAIVLMEQIYRARTIIQGHPYHH